MDSAERTVPARDLWIDRAEGRMFARLWSPQQDAGLAPIVLFHDSLGSVDLWRGFPAALGARTGRAVIAYDRLGFGRSDPHPGKLGFGFVAEEAETGFSALRRQLGIGPCVLFGHSVGGGMAVHCAARFGADCRALITESAQAFVEDRTVQGIEAARELFADPAQVERLRRYHGDKAPWVLDAWIGTWLHPDFASWSLRPVLPDVTCALLAVHGIDDEYGSASHPEIIGQLAAGPTRVELMADTRHIPHREREGEVVTLVGGFLDGID